MNIAIIGYGKMGRLIFNEAKKKGINVISTIDSYAKDAMYKEINKTSLKDVDVAIDFTHPDSIIDDIKLVSSLGVNMVVGTTGWYDRMSEVKEIVNKSKIGFIWSGNFSIGVNVFFKLIKKASEIMNQFDNYDVCTHEFHHNQKADSPSGTAHMIGDIIIENIDRKEKVVTTDLKRKIEPNELHVSSTRCGKIPGTHSVFFDSLADTIELKHQARGREGFALGAILASEFVFNKKGFFDINDLMDEIIKN
jgi:4-hydroxy-tetrahydrodipicolinate reductase